MAVPSLWRRIALLAALAVTCSPSLAVAQIVQGSPVEVAVVAYAPAPVSTEPSRAHLNGSSQLTSYTASLSLPLPVGDDTYVIPGVSYRHLQPTWTGPTPPGFQLGGLHALGSSLTVAHRFTDRWTLIHKFGVGFASDFEGDVTRGDIQLSTMTLASYRLLDELTLGAGLGYDRRTGTPLPLPLVGVRWQLTDDLMFRGVIPSRFGLAYRATSWLTSSIEGSYEGERFHVDEERFDIRELQAAFSVFKVGTGLTAHLPAGIHLELETGLVLHRRFDGLIGGERVFRIDQPRDGYAGLRLWFGLSGWEDPGTMRTKERE